MNECLFVLCLRCHHHTNTISTYPSRLDSPSTRSKYVSDSDESDTETASLDVEKLPPLEIGPGEHKLQYSYCLWYHRGSVTKFKSPMVRVNVNGPAVIVEPMLYVACVRSRRPNN